jgi:hypothetical protein
MFNIFTIESRSISGLDVSSSSALTMATSATSLGTDPWSSSGFAERQEDIADFSWAEEGLLLVPKLEPADDIDMAELSLVSEVKKSIIPEALSVSSTMPTKVKVPRGRPRKHPKATAESMAKLAKGRSKTGCITCRKRKKKCDETKPGCK